MKSGEAGVVQYESEESLYEKAVKRLQNDSLIVNHAYRMENYRQAMKMFGIAGDYLDSKEQAEFCRKRIEEIAEDEKAYKYQRALEEMEDPMVSEMEKAEKTFGELGDYKEASGKRKSISGKIQEKKRKQAGIRITFLAVLVLLAAAVVYLYFAGYVTYAKGRMWQILNKYEYARTAFDTSGCLDSEERSHDCKILQDLENLDKAETGDTIQFADLSWKVLSAEGDQLLMVLNSLEEDSIFYNVPFDTAGGSSWETSSLRNWLNGEVLEECFDEEERSCLIGMTTVPQDNPIYQTKDGGKETTDYIRILDAKEAKLYEDELSSKYDSWIAVPGEEEGTESFRTGGKTIMYYGCPSDSEWLCVCPVICADRTALKKGEAS